MIHIQATVPDWLEAVERLPDRSLVKSVDQGQVFSEVKAIASKRGINIYTCLRHWYDPGQVFGGNLEANKQKARDFFDTFIDNTFIRDIAPHCDFVEDWNEYLANSQNQNEINERAVWAAAAAEVWQHEYRSRQELSHIRLVLCNTAVGNFIPKIFFTIAQAHGNDCLIGYHPYSHYRVGQRAANDWADLSGLWHRMESEHNIKVDWLFSEAGPFESAVDGWRSHRCLNGSIDAYSDAVRDWIRDVVMTPAFQDGRIYGFALFTTVRPNSGRFSSYRTTQPELNLLADMIRQEWKSPSPKPQPAPDNQPPIPDPQLRGQPRLQYKRIFNVIPEYASDEKALSIFRAAWRRGRESVGGSYDDAGIGDLNNRIARLYGISESNRQLYLNWFDNYYQGTKVLFEEIPTNNPQSIFLWPVDSDVHVVTVGGSFDADRSYGRHEGLDLYAEIGDPILSAADGEVIWADNRRRADLSQSDYGNHIIIEHFNGYVTWYGHLSVINVLVGEIVSRGDQIGIAGSSGAVTGPHLHFAVQKIDLGRDGYVIVDVVDPAPCLGL
jgi:murein DD-endopeptidase MepM/ murein hydrolase activator NlpD